MPENPVSRDRGQTGREEGRQGTNREGRGKDDKMKREREREKKGGGGGEEGKQRGFPNLMSPCLPLW